MKIARKFVAIAVSTLMMFSIAGMNVFAASTTQDGLEVSLTTDKEAYSKDEKITATLSVKNTNAKEVTDVTMETVIPDGYEVADGTKNNRQLDKLLPNESTELKVVYVAGDSGEDSEVSNENSRSETINTGDTTVQLAIIIPVTICSLVLIVFGIRKKRIKSFLSIAISISMLGSFVTFVSFETEAVENKKVNITLSHKIKVNNIDKIIDANVSFSTDIQEGRQLDLNDLGVDKQNVQNFEEKEANPTFGSYEEEVANISKLNNNYIPFITYDSNSIPNYIDGRFSSRIINNKNTAMESLKDIEHIMNFQNADQEFVYVESNGTDSINETVFYKFQQVYHNVPVYNYQLIISTDQYGEIKTLTGHYYPNININCTPTIKIDEAKSIVIDDNEDNTAAVSDGLCIYILNDEPILSWNIKTLHKRYFINAIDGSVVSAIEMNCFETTGKGNNLSNNEVAFPVKEENNTFSLDDDIRNIHVYDAGHRTLPSSGTISSISEGTNTNWNSHSEAISAYTQLIKVYDYYYNILGRKGCNNPSGNTKNNEISLIVNYRDNNNKELDNAFCSSTSNNTFICIGDARNNSRCNSLDTIAHEYTHSITENVIPGGLEYLNESGALNESYSDIIGNLIEDGKLEEHGEHLVEGPIRSFSNPSKFGDVANVKSHKSYCTKSGDHSKHGCDNGHVHSNSGIPNHAAYLIDKNWPTKNHANELATLFYQSMNYMSSRSSFLDFRNAVLSAAKSMNMSSEKLKVIANAFNEVGIIYEDQEVWASAHHIIGEVEDSETHKKIIDAEIIAVATKGLGGGVGYSNGDGHYDVKVNRNTYNIFVYADGYLAYKQENIDLSSWTDMNYYVPTIKLTPAPWKDDTQKGFVAGCITDSSDGHGLIGVKLRFRLGPNNHSGDYFRLIDEKNIEVTTDEYGKYYISSLPIGDYTLEATKNDYITGFANVHSGSSDLCYNQDLSLKHNNTTVFGDVIYNDEPVNDVKVTLTDNEGNTYGSKFTENGKYSFEIDYISGRTYTAKFEKTGYQTISVTETDGGTNIQINAELKKDSNIELSIPADAFNYNGHSYYIYSGNAETWEEAKAYCESLGGYLAVINDDAENMALYNYMTSCGYQSAYFGYSDSETEGVWKWVNNDTSDYTNWALGEPNQERTTEDYAMFYFKYTDGKWNDGDFNGRTVQDTSAFICEWDNTEKTDDNYKAQLIQALLDNEDDWFGHYRPSGTGYPPTLEFMDLNFDGRPELIVTIGGGTSRNIDAFAVSYNNGSLSVSKDFQNNLNLYYDTVKKTYIIRGTHTQRDSYLYSVIRNFELSFDGSDVITNYYSEVTTETNNNNITKKYYSMKGESWKDWEIINELTENEYNRMMTEKSEGLVPIYVYSDIIGTQKYDEFSYVKKKDFLEKAYDSVAYQDRSDQIQYYNNKHYYTPTLTVLGGGSGLYDFSQVGADYIALPKLDIMRNVSQKVTIDNFIIVDDVIYFTNKYLKNGPGDDTADLYKCDMNGSSVTKIAESVYFKFYHMNGNIFFKTNNYKFNGIEDKEQCYIISTGKITNTDFSSYHDYNSRFSPYGEANDIVKYYCGGMYYQIPNDDEEINKIEKANMFIHRVDKNGNDVIVGKWWNQAR